MASNNKKELQDAKISVPHFAAKLRVLYALPSDDDGPGFPKNREQLASTLNTLGPHRSSINSTSISRVEEIKTRMFSIDIHQDILAAFNLSWPMPEYFDCDGLGFDQSVSRFRAAIQPNCAAFKLQKQPRNAREFPNEDLFVLELVDQAASDTYTGLMVAKPGDIPIKEIEGELAGLKLGRAGFSEFTINVRVPADAEAESWRSPEIEAKADKNITFRSRDSNPDKRWRVRWRPLGRDERPYFDDNIDVAYLAVSKMADDETLILQVTAPLPDLEPQIETAELAPGEKDKLEARMRRLAENLVLEQFRNADGTLPVNKDILTIGEVHFRKVRSE